MVAYNLKRLVNIIGIDAFREYLKNITALFLAKSILLKSFLSLWGKLKQEIQSMVEIIQNKLMKKKMNEITITQRGF